jgi:hypothetical protein
VIVFTLSSIASAQSLYPPPFTFPGEPYNTQPIAPNFFLYTSNEADANISGYSINAATGALIPISGSPFAYPVMSPAVYELNVDPTGRCAVAVDDANGTIQSFSIDPNSGALTPYGTPISVMDALFIAAIDPSGRFVYAGSYNTGKIYGYILESGNCQLDPIPGSPFPGGGALNKLMVDPTGRWFTAP